MLLFSIQPMVAKALLPVYGGTPAVWTICMLFFQVVMLLAYAYAWLLSTCDKRALWRSIHTVLICSSLFSIPLVFHPIALNTLPEFSILYNLASQLGLPLLVVAASAPLLQFAYSKTTGKGASDPYFLYVASNLGSLLALLMYPWVFERFIGLSVQYKLWNCGYVLYLLILSVLLFFVSYKPLDNITHSRLKSNDFKQIGLWIFLSFVPCSLMLGVTLYITTDIAATPLFWVLPLALYLLSFVLAFTPQPFSISEWLIKNSVFFLIFTIIGFILGAHQVKAWQVIFVNLLSFFSLALLSHRQLYLKRPSLEKLTLFYFCIALGGVLAGLFNGIVARHIFNQVYEYPIAILLSLLILPMPNKKGGLWVLLAVLSIFWISKYAISGTVMVSELSTQQLAALLALIIIVVWQQSKVFLFLSMSSLFLFLFLIASAGSKGVLLQDRSFYAVNRVVETNGIHVFLSQSTVHGLQIMGEPKLSNGLRGYYGSIQPVIDPLKETFNPLAVTIMGLGTGTMVCQFRNQDIIKVIEIDQQVIDIAKNPNLFTYLQDCPHIEIIKNDGRIAMTQLPNASQQLLILDAFNSDSIPMHLLTLEAFKLYKQKVSENGVILINLSNRHLNLLPVINAMGRSLNLMTFHRMHMGDAKKGQLASEWALLTSNEHLVTKLTRDTGWEFVADNNQMLWTDDYSNILPMVKW